MENTFEKEIIYPEIAERIMAMVVLDQEMRKRAHKDKDFWDEELDKGNTASMKEIISDIGWPTISKVGNVPSMNAWLLVQHADHNVSFQKECLNLMKDEPVGEVILPNIAYLEDRILVNDKKPQLYGTQFMEEDGIFTPKPIEDVEHVEDRRRQMGLDSLEENINRMYQKYDMKKPE